MSEPVKNTPIQPINGLKNVNAEPVFDSAIPKVADIPLLFAMYAKLKTRPIVNTGYAIVFSVAPKQSAASLAFTFKTKMLKIAANNIAVPELLIKATLLTKATFEGSAVAADNEGFKIPPVMSPKITLKFVYANNPSFANRALNGACVQIVIKTIRKINGDHA